MAGPSRDRFIIEQLIHVGLKILGADEGSLLTVEPGGATLKFEMVVSGIGLPVPDLAGKTVPIGEGITGMAALTHDVQASSRVLGGDFFPVGGDGSPSAVLAAPMLVGDRLVGVITAVSFNSEKIFSIDEAKTYGRFANIAAEVVELSRKARSKADGGVVRCDDAVEREIVDTALGLSRRGKGAALLGVLRGLAEM